MNLPFIPPMEPILINYLPQEKDLIYQIKWDGIRLQTIIEKSGLRLFTKRGKERTGCFPELNILLQPSLYNTYLDGELIIINEKTQKPDFQLMMKRNRMIKNGKNRSFDSIIYMVFDILMYNGLSLLNHTWKERDQILKKVLPISNHILPVESFDDGEALWDVMNERQWEGIVIKKINSSYHSLTNHKDWWKLKLEQKKVFHVGGLMYRDSWPSSLLLGYYQNSKLIYAGKVSAGLTQQMKQMLHHFLPQLEQLNTPFESNQIHRELIHWLKPILPVQVSFLEWTYEGHIRHPKILGFKNPMECK